MNTLNQNKSKKFATGWLIVVACMLIQAIPFGFIGYCAYQDLKIFN